MVLFVLLKEETQTSRLWAKSKMCLDLDLTLNQKYKSLSKTAKHLYGEPCLLIGLSESTGL